MVAEGKRMSGGLPAAPLPAGVWRRRVGGALLGSRFVHGSGAVLLALNLAVVGLSLTDMYILGSGAIRVQLPSEKDFSWRFETGLSAFVFESNYTIQNGGFYEISDLDIHALLSTASGVTLLNFTKRDLSIGAFSQSRNPITITLPVERILSLDFGSMLFSASYFFIDVEVSANYLLGLARFHSADTISYIWNPPLREYLNLFLSLNPNSLLNESFPYPDIARESFSAWVASAMLGKGDNVTVHSDTLDFVVRYRDGLMDLTVFPAGDRAEALYRTTLRLIGGGAPGG